MDILMELNVLQKQLNASLKSLRKTGTKFAEAERDYKMAISKKAIELRDNGMAVTMIDLVIYGCEEIATLRFIRDSAKVVYKANVEAINVLKLQIRVLQEQYSREYVNEV